MATTRGELMTDVVRCKNCGTEMTTNETLTHRCPSLGNEVTSDDEFRTELESLLNRHSQENGSNTPDTVLATFLVRCLMAFDAAVNSREMWYGRENIDPSSFAAAAE